MPSAGRVRPGPAGGSADGRLSAACRRSRRAHGLQATVALALAFTIAPALLASCSSGDQNGNGQSHPKGPTGLGATTQNWSLAHAPVSSSNGSA